MPKPVVDLSEQLSSLSQPWSPEVVARLNDYEVKVVKVEGEFVWHTHQDTDELFLVLAGELTIQLRDGSVLLRPGQLYVVPRGVEHCPRAEAVHDLRARQQRVGRGQLVGQRAESHRRVQ